jgi:hypothetical protein
MIMRSPHFPQVRILVLESDFAVSLHVRTAIHMSGIWSAVRTVRFEGASLYATCEQIRSGDGSPDLLLAECDARSPGAFGLLSLIPELPELCSVPLVVLGRGDDAKAKCRARRVGARAFIASPRRPGDLGRVASAIAQICGELAGQVG